MKPSRAAPIVSVCAMLFCCTTTESTVPPLGFGPLARTELLQHEQAATQVQAVARPPKKRRASSGAAARATALTTAHAAKADAQASGDAGVAQLGSADGGITPHTNEWLGLWRGKDTTTFQIPSFPPEPMADDHARIRVESVDEHNVKLVLIDSSNDRDLCTLGAHVESNRATIDPGQPCFGNEDESTSLFISVKTGAASLKDTRLVVDMALDAEIQSDQFQSTGSVEYHFDGRHE